jgi:hypothetical protein
LMPGTQADANDGSSQHSESTIVFPLSGPRVCAATFVELVVEDCDVDALLLLLLLPQAAKSAAMTMTSAPANAGRKDQPAMMLSPSVVQVVSHKSHYQPSLS